jgi:ribosomal-protein-alanine N-acetyltransferase
MKALEYDSSRLFELRGFARENAWKPAWPDDLVERFLTRLISTSACVIDLRDEDRRVAVGVLVDRVSNPANHACLEVLGLDAKAREADAPRILEALLAEARRRLPAEKAGFQLSLHPSAGIDEAWCRARGLEPHYDSYDMLNENPGATPPPPESHAIEPLADGDLAELHRVLTEAFSENPDTSVPAFEEWSESRKKHEAGRCWITRRDGRIAGFVIAPLAGPANEDGEIRTLGVLPSARGLGLGRALLCFALRELARAGARRCSLSVFARNDRALALYESAGFRVADRCRVFAWQRPAQPKG